MVLIKIKAQCTKKRFKKTESIFFRFLTLQVFLLFGFWKKGGLLMDLATFTAVLYPNPCPTAQCVWGGISEGWDCLLFYLFLILCPHLNRSMERKIPSPGHLLPPNICRVGGVAYRSTCYLFYALNSIYLLFILCPHLNWSLESRIPSPGRLLPPNICRVGFSAHSSTYCLFYASPELKPGK